MLQWVFRDVTHTQGYEDVVISDVMCCFQHDVEETRRFGPTHLQRGWYNNECFLVLPCQKNVREIPLFTGIGHNSRKAIFYVELREKKRVHLQRTL